MRVSLAVRTAAVGRAGAGQAGTGQGRTGQDRTRATPGRSSGRGPGCGPGRGPGRGPRCGPATARDRRICRALRRFARRRRMPGRLRRVLWRWASFCVPHAAAALILCTSSEFESFPALLATPLCPLQVPRSIALNANRTPPSRAISCVAFSACSTSPDIAAQKNRLSYAKKTF